MTEAAKILVDPSVSIDDIARSLAHSGIKVEKTMQPNLFVITKWPPIPARQMERT